jgi:type VI secretion system protein
MFQDRTLLERLTNPSAARTRTLSEDTREQARSIVRHLRKMLNSRQGHAPAQLEYGLPALESLIRELPGAVPEILREVRACIERFEKRLRVDEVGAIEPVDTKPALALHIRIEGELVNAARRAPVTFDTLVDGSGRIQVRV